MDAQTAVTAPRHLPRRTPWAIVARLEAPVETIGFWAALALPEIYLSLSVWGIDSQLGRVVFLGLLSLHLIALVVGHDHQPDRIGRVGTGPWVQSLSGKPAWGVLCLTVLAIASGCLVARLQCE